MGQRRESSWLWLALGIALVYGFKHDWMLNKEAPAFSLRETYGAQVDLASFKGQPVLLVFWTTSCGICRRELPLITSMSDEFRNHGIAVVTVHLGEADDVREYLRVNHITGTALLDGDGHVGREYGVEGVPKTVLVGADGKIKGSHSGMAGAATLRDWMNLVSTS